MAFLDCCWPTYLPHLCILFPALGIFNWVQVILPMPTSSSWFTIFLGKGVHPSKVEDHTSIEVDASGQMQKPFFSLAGRQLHRVVAIAYLSGAQYGCPLIFPLLLCTGLA